MTCRPGFQPRMITMQPEIIRRIRPRYSDRQLGNPHKGCCTFQRFQGDPLNQGTLWSEEGPVTFSPPLDAAARRIIDWGRWEGVVRGYLPSTVAYCRWFWALFEPREGEYDFTVVEQALQAARARGQTLAVRLMAYGSSRQPQIPEWYASRYPVEVKQPKSDQQTLPVHDAPEYLARWGGLIREFGRRFDGRLESIDIAYIGPWGEGAGACSAEQCERFAALWREAFPRTPLLALIDHRQMEPGFRVAASGWRCDCFGDVGIRHYEGALSVPRTECFNHHFDSYPRRVATAGAQEAWKTGPVHLETCGVPMDWYRRGHDLDFILQQGLKFHATYFMPKSCALPEPWLERLAAFCRQLGYRFAFRQAVLPRSVARGGPLPMQVWIENVGVAPIYHRYTLAFRFRQDDRELITTLPDIDIRSWLPGDVWFERDVPVPDGLRPGWVGLSVGLVDAQNQAQVRFAAEETYLDRWLDLSGFELR